MTRKRLLILAATATIAVSTLAQAASYSADYSGTWTATGPSYGAPPLGPLDPAPLPPVPTPWTGTLTVLVDDVSGLVTGATFFSASAAPGISPTFDLFEAWTAYYMAPPNASFATEAGMLTAFAITSVDPVNTFGFSGQGATFLRSGSHHVTLTYGSLTMDPVQAIPEPSTYALMLLGLLGCGCAALARAHRAQVPASAHFPIA